jgi:hypothetical protein
MSFFNSKKKKKKPDNAISGYCSSPIFLPKKVARVTTFQGHLMLHLSTKSNKPYTSMMGYHYTTP